VYSTGRGGAGNLHSPSRDASRVRPAQDKVEQEVIREYAAAHENAPVSFFFFCAVPVSLRCGCVAGMMCCEDGVLCSAGCGRFRCLWGSPRIIRMSGSTCAGAVFACAGGIWAWWRHSVPFHSVAARVILDMMPHRHHSFRLIHLRTYPCMRICLRGRCTCMCGWYPGLVAHFRSIPYGGAMSHTRHHHS
jgi:hypothetical protein